MKWMIKGQAKLLFSRLLVAEELVFGLFLARVNSVMFYLLWTCAPILVSIISFFAYVMQGKELTASIAFTVSNRFQWRWFLLTMEQAIALFNMIRYAILC